MAQRTWVGGLATLPSATQVAQVWSTTVASASSSTTYTISLTNETGSSISFNYAASGGDTTTTIAAALAALITASNDARAKAVTAAAVTGVLTLTAKSAGVPFYAAATVAGGSGSFSGTGNTTANVGKNDWNTVSNWLEGSVPGSSDNVLITGSNNISYGLVTGTSLGGFATQAGSSASVGAVGSPLSFTCTSFYWSCSGTSCINIGSSAISPRIVNTANATAPSCGLYLIGSAMVKVYVEGQSSVDLASTPGVTSTATTVQLVGTQSPRVRCGSGLTLTNFNCDSAATGTEIACAVTSATIEGGTVSTAGTGTIGTLNVNGGSVYCNSTGTITTANVNDGGKLDMTQSQIARTITTANLSRGATLLYDPGVITVTTLAIASGAGPMTVAVA